MKLPKFAAKLGDVEHVWIAFESLNKTNVIYGNLKFMFV